MLIGAVGVSFAEPATPRADSKVVDSIASRSFDAEASARGEPTDDVNVTQTIANSTDHGVVEVTVDVRIDGAHRVDVAVPSYATIRSSTSFERVDAGGAYDVYTWNEPADTVSLTYRVHVDEPSEAGRKYTTYDAVGTTGWTFASNPTAIVRVDDELVNSTSRTSGPGVVADGYVFLGAHQTYTRTVGDERIRLVVPSAVASKVDPNATLATLAAASRDLDVGGTDDDVTAFGVPDPMRGGGEAHSGDFWVHAESSTNGSSVWIHEYVHTRQTYRVSGSGRMDFAVEGVAEYYESLLSLRAGNMTYAAFHDQVETPIDASGILADADPDLGGVEYTKGRRVIGALDAKIRNETNGSKSFEDVFARMNRDADGVVTYADFKDDVEAVAGTSFDTWIDKYVKTRFAPDIPRDRYAVSRPSEDVDGDGLDTAAERDASTNPFDEDTDDDGLSDGREVDAIGSDPNDEDTDGDGVEDGQEVAAGSDPTNASERATLATANATDGAGTLADEDDVAIGEDEMASDPTGVPGFSITTSALAALLAGLLASRRSD